MNNFNSAISDFISVHRNKVKNREFYTYLSIKVSYRSGYNESLDRFGMTPEDFNQSIVDLGLLSTTEEVLKYNIPCISQDILLQVHPESLEKLETLAEDSGISTEKYTSALFTMVLGHLNNNSKYILSK